MAVKVQNGGTFTKDPGQRPGLYVRFVERAIASIGVGSRSKVATVKSVFTGKAVAGKVYRVTGMEQALDLFGETNIEDIRMIFAGGASEVVVTVSAEAPTSWLSTLQKLESYEFHVFVLPHEADALLVNDAVSWAQECKANGMNFVSVFADEDAEGDITLIKNEATDKADEYNVFVANGVVKGDGTEVTADKYASYVAGLIAGTALDGSLTYHEVPFVDVITRFRSVEIKELLAAGVLVTVVDGDTTRIEQGLTLGQGQFNKIRTVRAKQAMIDDINAAVQDNYIGKITNSPDGQIAVLNAIKAYLQTLADSNVIDAEYIVELDKSFVSTGAEVYISVAVKFLDSIEYVYLTVTV